MKTQTNTIKLSKYFEIVREMLGGELEGDAITNECAEICRTVDGGYKVMIMINEETGGIYKRFELSGDRDIDIMDIKAIFKYVYNVHHNGKYTFEPVAMGLYMAKMLDELYVSYEYKVLSDYQSQIRLI